MTHEELALRIEALDGPDREVDTMVMALFTGKKWPPRKGLIYVADPYTASLDAAASLMPEGWELVSVDRSWQGQWEVIVVDDNEDHHYAGLSKTECLARLAAAVRAHGKELDQ